ncbi:adipolin-like [Eriocheir sinensis]|uniref:adipolin-like n=1 Tax=Eriocheir sinensis TaxID=95602 RepID=UPI0021C9AB7D|nr:adipolin-like [Eriocheir sinensis]XP_050710902.1 adipolin-like [Eriocheir sinensis]
MRAGVCWRTGALGAWLLLLLLVSVRAAEGVRSMVRGSHTRDVSLGSNTLQSLQTLWQKEGQEEERPHVFDPRQTWDFFLRNSEAQRTRTRKNRLRNRKNRIPMPKEGPAGPPGRRGPMGPPGAPGGTLTTQEMEEYIKEFLREYLSQNNTAPNATSLESAESQRAARAGRGRVKAAFTAILPRPIVLNPLGLSIVDAFTITFSPGVFERRMVLQHGGFSAIKRGIYQVAASLVLHPHGRPSSPPLDKPQDISVYLCITTCARDRRRLEWSGGLGEGTVTAVLVGHVVLVRGDTLLVAVDNPTKRPLQVRTGSSFSAALIGT